LPPQGYRPPLEERTEEAFFEDMTTMIEGLGTALDQIMTSGLFGAIVAR